MFAPAEMSEVDIFVYDEHITAVAQAIARLGVLHLMDGKALGQWSTNVDSEWNGRVTQYTNQERRVLDLLAHLGIEESLGLCPAKLDPAGDLVEIETRLQAIEERVSALREQESALVRDQKRWDLIARSMERLAPLWVSISDLRQLEHLHLVGGTIPLENIARLEASLFRIPYTIIPVHRYGDRSLIFAFCAQEHAPILDRALQSAFLEPLALPEEFNGTAQEVLEQVRQKQQETAAQLYEINQQYHAIAEEVRGELLELLTRIRADRAVAAAMAQFGHRGHVYLIAGWVPKDRVDELRAAVDEASGGAATFEENPPDVLGTRLAVPTLLRNPRIFRAIELLVTTYGVPGYREIDPTLLVALTFVFMFGIMFGDLGHGLVLASLGALLALRVIRPWARLGDLGYTLLACGLSSSVFGLLYGSVFGLEEVIPHLWLKPMHDIPTLLGASIVFGVVILNIGFACRLITAVREKALWRAIFDKNGLAGLLLYWSLGAVVILAVLGKPVPGYLLGWIALLLFCLFFAEPLTNLLEGKRPLFGEGHVFEILVQAFFELFEALIGYVSNTLSYVRLGAFAVAHAGLTMVVFILADMISANPSLAFMRSLIILFGNILVIGFEGLIVGIQTLRLEYYELFGKFYDGEGVPYKPLTLPVIECIPATS